MKKKLKRLEDIFGKRWNEYSTKKRFPRKEDNLEVGPFQNTLEFVSLVENWEKVVGKMLASNSRPLKIQRGKLILICKSAAFSNEIGFLANPLIKKIKGQFPKLKFSKLGFICSESIFNKKMNEKIEEKRPQPKVPKHKYSPQYNQLKKKVEAEFDFFDDADENQFKELLVSLKIQQSELENS